jgi:hypothetical protein
MDVWMAVIREREEREREKEERASFLAMEARSEYSGGAPSRMEREEWEEERAAALLAISSERDACS